MTMNRTWTWLTVAVAAGCSPSGGQEGPEGASQATVDSAQVVTEVQGFLAEYLTAIEARDEEAVRNRLLSERYRWVEDGEVRYRHVEDVLESLAQFPAGMPIR
ncbi:MAG: hypothetical protein HKO53_16805, partial [Gemmatimonadetes bacterium]|nr:hypothetical protein [Gemmatimonadota bacterium]